eukprot:960724-Pleurochrysis_carterae.AAC.5
MARIWRPAASTAPIATPFNQPTLPPIRATAPIPHSKTSRTTASEHHRGRTPLPPSLYTHSHCPVHLRALLQQQLTHRLRRAELVDWRRRRRRTLLHRVARDHHHRVGVRDPHVAHVLVRQVVLVARHDARARVGKRVLHELVRLHALDRHLAHDAESAEAHTRQLEQLRVVL